MPTRKMTRAHHQERSRGRVRGCWRVELSRSRGRVRGRCFGSGRARRWGAGLLWAFFGMYGAAQAIEPTVLLCPKGEGICAYTPPADWRLLWSTEVRLGLEFWRPRDHFIVAKLSGHVGPHYLVVLDDSGNVILARNLWNDGRLREVSGPGPRGSIVVCQGTWQGQGCDTVVGSWESAHQLFWDAYAGVPPCSFPRVDEEDRSICLVSGPPRRLVRFARNGAKEEIELDSSVDGVVDVAVVRDKIYLISDDENLWVTDFGRLERVGVENVHGIWPSSIGAILELRTYQEATRAFRCGIGLVVGHSVRRLWEGDCIGVDDVVEVEPGVLLVDSWSARRRDIVKLEVIKEGKARATKLWSEIYDN